MDCQFWWRWKSRGRCLRSAFQSEEFCSQTAEVLSVPVGEDTIPNRVTMPRILTLLLEVSYS